jgi:hypothetical protein
MCELQEEMVRTWLCGEWCEDGLLIIHTSSRHGKADCPTDNNLTATLELAVKEGWQRCFGCHALVERLFGCQHIIWYLPLHPFFHPILTQSSK